MTWKCDQMDETEWEMNVWKSSDYWWGSENWCRVAVLERTRANNKPTLSNQTDKQKAAMNKERRMKMNEEWGNEVEGAGGSWDVRRPGERPEGGWESGWKEMEGEGEEKSEQAKGGGCCFRISTDECVSPLWGGGPSALYVCHSTRLCLASRER